jgi:hypothetical protein
VRDLLCWYLKSHKTPPLRILHNLRLYLRLKSDLKDVFLLLQLLLLLLHEMKNATFLLLLLFQKVYYCLFPHFKIFPPLNSTHLYFSLESLPAKIKAEKSLPAARIKAFLVILK